MIKWLSNLFKRKDPQVVIHRPEGSEGEWSFRVTREEDDVMGVHLGPESKPAVQRVHDLIHEQEREGLRATPETKVIYAHDIVAGSVNADGVRLDPPRVIDTRLPLPMGWTVVDGVPHDGRGIAHPSLKGPYRLYDDKVLNAEPGHIEVPAHATNNKVAASGEAK